MLGRYYLLFRAGAGPRTPGCGSLSSADSAAQRHVAWAMSCWTCEDPRGPGTPHDQGVVEIVIMTSVEGGINVSMYQRRQRSCVVDHSTLSSM